MKPIAFLLTFLLCWGCFSKTEGQINDLVFLNGETHVDIPFDYENNFIVIKLMFNDIFPLKFIFDTGAENTILTKREITDLFQIDYQRRFNIYGADLSQNLYAYLVRGISFRIGDLRASQRSILVLEEDYFQFDEFSGIDIHGILGADFFRRFIVRINYYKQVITLYDPSTFQLPKGRFTEVPLEMHRSKPYLLTSVRLNNDTTIQTKLLMDTGASIALLLYSDTHPQLKVPEKVIRSVLGRGLGGIIYGYLGRVRMLSFSEHAFNEVLTNFQELPIVEDSSYMNNRNGIIGNQLLDRFTLIIDYVHNRVFLQPNPYYKKKFEFDRSGLFITASGPSLSKFIVFDIVPSSPSDKAGIVSGDEIKSVNGVPATFFKLQDLMYKFRGRLGKRVRLVIVRNGEKIKKEFKLEDII
ncbi:MAG: aspartyl protease family protein [Haliscomenobacter sp.]|nr:aspartyl protease family protein [Haliscomenobacter sp.]MBK9488486.1 aspartyl protease family protein [Haliscomenobacter sp.]